MYKDHITKNPLTNLHFTLHTAHCTKQHAKFPMHIAQCRLCNVHCTVHIAHCTHRAQQSSAQCRALTTARVTVRASKETLLDWTLLLQLLLLLLYSSTLLQLQCSALLYRPTLYYSLLLQLQLQYSTTLLQLQYSSILANTKVHYTGLNWTARV